MLHSDLNHTERSARSAELVVACLPSNGRIVTLETDDGRLQVDALPPLMELSRAGCERVRAVMSANLAAYADGVLRSRGVQPS
jgi:ribonuclease PH